MPDSHHPSSSSTSRVLPESAASLKQAAQSWLDLACAAAQGNKALLRFNHGPRFLRVWDEAEGVIYGKNALAWLEGRDYASFDLSDPQRCSRLHLPEQPAVLHLQRVRNRSGASQAVLVVLSEHLSEEAKRVKPLLAAWAETLSHHLQAWEQARAINSYGANPDKRTGGVAHARYLHFFKQANEALIVADARSGIILEVNDKATELFGRSPEDLIGSHFTSLHPRDEVAQHHANFARSSAQEKSFFNRVNVITNDGRRLPVQVSSSRHQCDGRDIIFSIFVDLTSEVRNQQALRHSEQRFAAFINQSGLAAWMKDQEGRYLFVNSTMQRQLRLSHESILGLTDLEWLPADVALRTQAHDAAVVARGREIESIESFPSPDGETRTWHVWRFPYQSPKGELCIGGVAIDITYKKRADDDRDRLFKEAADLFVIAGFDGYFRLLNPAWEQALGYALDEIEAKPVLELVHPDDREATRKIWSEMGHAEEALRFENRYRRRDGEYRWFAWNGIVNLTQQRFYGVVRDITEHKLAQEALQRSEERFQMFMNNVSALVFVKDEEGRIVFCNRSYAEHFGMKPEDVIGKTDAMLADPDLAAQFQVNDRIVFDMGKSIEVREESVDVNGQTHFWQVVKFPYQDAYGKRFIGGLAIDITHNVVLENQVRQMQKIDTVGQMAAGIAHDYNNILTVQQGFAEHLLSDENIPERWRKGLTQILAATERASQLTRQLLLFSSNQPVELKPQSLNAIIKPFGTMLKRLLGANITLDLHCDPAIPDVSVDAGMMEQVVMNLVINARDAIVNDGTIRVLTHTRRIEKPLVEGATEVSPGLYVVLDVVDNGAGIPRDKISHIFEPFYTTKPKGKGTGLGLSTVYAIVRHHHGWVTVDSHEGKGTCFSIHLPALLERHRPQATARPSQQPFVPQTPLNGRRVMVVEDERALADFMTMILQDHGAEVVLARNASEARRQWMLPDEAFDLVIADMVLPHGESGAQLVSQLLRDKPDLPIIFTSGYAEAAEKAQNDSGLTASTLLTKPFSLNQFIDAVLQAMALR
jgi:PAS domain S-box-containing protein